VWKLFDEHYLLNAVIPNYAKPMLEHKNATKIAIEKFKNGAV